MSKKFREKPKQYSLFIHPRSKGSKKCMKILLSSAAQDMFNIINIQNIPAKRKPSFVDGAPILLDHTTKDLCKGRRCLNFIRVLCQDNRIFNAPSEQTKCLVTSLTKFDGDRQIFNGYQALDLSQTLGEESYESKNKTKKITETSVQQYQKLRDQMTAKINKRLQNSKIEMLEE